MSFVFPAGTAPELSILVVTYQSAQDIDACLASLPAAVGARHCEVVLVDNASTDDSIDHVRAHDVPTRLLRNSTNVGFGAAVNQAAGAASGEWLVLLNPDTVCRPGSLAALLDFAQENPQFGVYGGRTVSPDGEVDPRSCWGAPSLRSLASFALGLSTLRPRSLVFDPESLGRWPRDTVREVDAVTGCLLLVRADTWHRLGGFDERFWLYGEDLDLCTRAREQGLRPVITPTATVVHTVGASSSTENKTIFLTAGRLTWVLVHWRGPRRVLGMWLIRSAVGVRAGLAPLTGRGAKWRGAWQRRAEWWNGFPPLVPTQGAPAPDRNAVLPTLVAEQACT